MTDQQRASEAGCSDGAAGTQHQARPHPPDQRIAGEAPGGSEWGSQLASTAPLTKNGPTRQPRS
jgi:hypothetical protein